VFEILLTRGVRFVENDMPIRIRCLDKFPIHCNLQIQKEMSSKQFRLHKDVMPARKQDSAPYADGYNIC